MKATTFSKLGALAAVAGAVAVLAPTAAGQASFSGSPDAVDRAVAASQAELRSTALEARERGMIERPAVAPVGPDAFERALITHGGKVSPQITPLERREQLLAMLERREQSLATRPPSSSQIATTSSAFDWSDFGIGAGTGIVLMLALLGLGAGVLATRRSDEHVATA